MFRTSSSLPGLEKALGVSSFLLGLQRASSWPRLDPPRTPGPNAPLYGSGGRLLTPRPRPPRVVREPREVSGPLLASGRPLRALGPQKNRLPKASGDHWLLGLSPSSRSAPSAAGLGASRVAVRGSCDVPRLSLRALECPQTLWRSDFFNRRFLIAVGPRGPSSGPRTKNGSGTLNYPWGRGPDFCWGRGLRKSHRRMWWSSSPRPDPPRSSGQNAPGAEERSAASPRFGGRQQLAHRGGRRTPLERARRAGRRPKKPSSFETSEIWVFPPPSGPDRPAGTCFSRATVPPSFFAGRPAWGKRSRPGRARAVGQHRQKARPSFF